jgi:hypothetical protein
MKLLGTWMIAAIVLAGMLGCGKGGNDGKTMTFDTPEGKVRMNVDQSGGPGAAGKVTYDTPQGKVTYEGDGKTMKAAVTDKDGKVQNVEISSKVDLAAFEGLVYPGAVPENETSLSSYKTNEQSTVTGSFVTSDSPEKILEHYKKALPEAATSSFGAVSTVSAKTPKGADLSVMIVKGEGTEKTKLTIGVIRKQ